MAFFQVSVPPNIIPFCLENQTKEKSATPNLPPTNHLDAVEDPFAEPKMAKAVESPRSADSEPDVNAFAEAMVQQMESKQASTQEETILADTRYQ